MFNLFKKKNQRNHLEEELEKSLQWYRNNNIIKEGGDPVYMMHYLTSKSAQYFIYEHWDNGWVYLIKKTDNTIEKLGKERMEDDNLGRSAGEAIGRVISTGIELAKEDIRNNGETVIIDSKYGKHYARESKLKELLDD